MLSPSGYSALNDSEDFELSPATSSPTNENAERDAENELVKDAEDSLQDPQVSLIKHESMLQIALEMLLPFIFAGIGMVLAGLLFDHVQHWKVFGEVHELFILIPPLLGLKGNLEMTLASRLSTAANLKILDEWPSLRSIVLGNLALCQCQALVVSLLVSVVAILFNWVPEGELRALDTLLLCSSSMLTASIASGVLGMVMVLVVIVSLRLGINPDNVVTPIAASLGDLTTLYLLAVISRFFFEVHSSYPIVMPVLIAVFILLIPIWAMVAYRNEYVSDVLISGWEPVIAAMVISSGGGFILDLALASNQGVAVFSPVINGVGGNLVAVFSSRISTYLHGNYERGELPSEFGTGCVQPCFLFCGDLNPQKRAANVMILLVIPGQLIFLAAIRLLNGGHIEITLSFTILYLLSSVLQVIILLHIAWWLVHRVWRSGDDPDSVAIPYLTAFGDLIGIGLLTVAFQILAVAKAP